MAAQILATLFGALIISSDALSTLGLGPLSLGCLLLAANCAMVVLSAAWCAARLARETEERAWRQALTTAQLGIVAAVMDQGGGARGGCKDGGGGGGGGSDANAVLQQYLLHPSDVTLGRRIGAGAFGAVYHGERSIPWPLAPSTSVREASPGLWRRRPR